MTIRTLAPALLVASALVAAGAAGGVASAQTDPDRTARLRDAALTDDVAMDITAGLTTEVGPRLAGTEAEARARDWGVAKLRALGFRNVRIETCAMPVWRRGEERGEIVGPFPARLALTALGNSGATPPGGIQAPVIYFPTLADLEAVPAGSLAGKIAFVSHAMKPTQDGSSYGVFGRVRRAGPSIAAQKGAAAIVIRSVGTDYHRNPHAGLTVFAPGVRPIPAAALALPDAENLERILARAGRRPVVMRLLLTPTVQADGQSGNVIGEVPGSDRDAGIVVIGGHLDSWDLATGAIDDASGVAITTAAAKRIMDGSRRPRRTIRVVWFGAEEVQGCGGPDYLARHGDERHALAAESDFGADRVWQLRTRLPANAAPVTARLAAALGPLGIASGTAAADGGADIGPLVATGVPVLDLVQDGTRYFDYHHTPDDTLDKVDPQQLRQNVAAWTAMLDIVANAPEKLDRVMVPN